jgi:hypothetical protein
MTKRFRTLAALAAAASALGAATSASATPVTATIRAEGLGSTLVTGTATTDARTVDGHAITSATALTLLADVAEPQGIPFECEWSQFGCGLVGVAGEHWTFADPYYWRLVVDDVDAQLGISSQPVVNGTRVALVVTPNNYPTPPPPLLELSVSSDALQVGASFTATARSFDTTSGASVPAAGARIAYGTQAAIADANGNATFIASGAGSQALLATADGATRSGRPVVCAFVSDPTACKLPALPTTPSPTPTTPTTPTAPLPATTGQADTVPPASRITTPRLFSKDRHVVRLGGAVAPDRSDVASVQYALAKLSGTQCRFRQANGKLGALHACTQRTWLPARGGAFWTVALHAALAPGRYRVWSRATDGAGNQERSFVTGSSSGTFTVVK